MQTPSEDIGTWHLKDYVTASSGVLSLLYQAVLHGGLRGVCNVSVECHI